MLLTITHEKCALLKMARSKASVTIFASGYSLQVEEISMNSTIKTKRKTILRVSVVRGN